MGRRWQEWRSGWPIVVGSSFGMGTGIVMYNMMAGFFINPLSKAFGWSRGQISIGSGALFLAAILMPAIGMLVDRHGPRRLMIIGAISFSAAYMALSVMPGSIAYYYAVLLMIGLIAGPATAPPVFTRPLVNVFVASRGLALGMGLSGGGLLAIAILPVLQHVVATDGWRWGYAMMAPITLAFGLGAAFLLPGNKRWSATRAAMTARDQAGSGEAGLTFREGVADVRFWLLIVSVASIAACVVAFNSQLQPMLSDRRVPGSTGAIVAMLAAAATFVGRVGSGFMLDRFWAPGVAAVALFLPVVGLSLFQIVDAPVWLMAISAILVAVCAGAEGDLVAFFAARYFGLKAFGALFGALGTAYGVFSAVGAIGAGISVDRTGNYDIALRVATILSAASAIAILWSGLIRRSPPPAVLTDADGAAALSPADARIARDPISPRGSSHAEISSPLLQAKVNS